MDGVSHDWVCLNGLGRLALVCLGLIDWVGFSWLGHCDRFVLGLRGLLCIGCCEGLGRFMLIGLWGIVLVGLLSLGRVVLSDLRLGADSRVNFLSLGNNRLGLVRAVRDLLFAAKDGNFMCLCNRSRGNFMAVIFLCGHVIILLGGWILWTLRISIWLLDDLELVVKLAADNAGRVEDSVGISEESSWVGLNLGELEAGASVRNIVSHFKTRGEWACQAS